MSMPRFGAAVFASALAVLLTLCFLRSSSTPVASPPADEGQPGHPRRDLTAAELAAFDAGKRLFTETPPTFGPLYNDTACANCHAIPTLGGSGDLDHAYYIGPGSGMEIELYRKHALSGWMIPPRPANVGPRIAPPLYGLGLVEQIPDETIRAACGEGHTTHAKDQGSLPRNRVSRFGIKPFLGTLVDFAGSELLAQLMVTNSLEGTSDRYGVDDDAFPDPEVGREFAEKLAAFVRGLQPPGRNGTDAVGEAAFRSFGCATCHVPDMSPARNVFSDFCVHHIGEALADGIVDRTAQGDEFRTAPLWGLRFKKLYLHDGRATSLDDAITAHGGEARGSASAYSSALPEKRAALLRFLDTL